MKEPQAQCRREHSGSGGESGELEIAQVDNGGTLPDSADHARGIDALKQRAQIGVLRGIFTHHGVLDGEANLGIDQTADHVEAGFLIGAEIGFVLDVER